MTDIKARFLGPLRVEELDDCRRLLLEDLAFYSVELSGILVAPAGMISNYASSPRIAWRLFPRDGEYKKATVIHDGAYQAALVTTNGLSIHLIKILADKLFLEAMVALNIPRWQRRAMYIAVRKFGGSLYGGLGKPLVEDKPLKDDNG